MPETSPACHSKVKLTPYPADVLPDVTLLIVHVLFTTFVIAVPVEPLARTASETLTEKLSVVPVLFVIVTGL